MIIDYQQTHNDATKENGQQVSQKGYWWQVNKIIYPPIILMIICLPVIIGAWIVHTQESLVVFGIYMVLFLFCLWRSMDNIWIYRRLPTMSPNHYKMVKVNINTPQKTAEVYDEDSRIIFVYDAKEKQFFLKRTMYTNPRRYPKEYEERKYQFKTRTERTRIPFDGGISMPESCICFHIYIKLAKRDATLENIRKFRDVIIGLAEDDFNQLLCCKFMLDDGTLYLETFHYYILRALLVKADGSIECFDMRQTSKMPDRLSKIFNEFQQNRRMDKLQSDDLMGEDEFEYMWENYHEGTPLLHRRLSTTSSYS